MLILSALTLPQKAPKILLLLILKNTCCLVAIKCNHKACKPHFKSALTAVIS